jgi:hypothetical protein
MPVRENLSERYSAERLIQFEKNKHLMFSNAMLPQLAYKVLQAASRRYILLIIYPIIYIMLNRF